MKKQKIILMILTIMVLMVNVKQVRADSPECQAELGNYNTKVAVEEEFIYDIGTMGAASNTYINEIYYTIEYDKDDLEVVDIKGTTKNYTLSL